MNSPHSLFHLILSGKRLMFVGCFVAIASGILATPGRGQTIVATGDSYVRSLASEANTNHGSETTLMVSNRTSGNIRKIYLSFELSSLGSVTIDSTSSLSLTLASSSYLIGTTSGSFTLEVYGITDSTATFNESTITWDNAPKNSNVNSNDNNFSSSGVTSLGTITINTDAVTGGTSVTLSGTALANYLNWALGNSGDYYGTGTTSATGGIVTLMIRSSGSTSNSNTGFYFYSTEASVADSLKPHLNLVTSEIPEPATIAIIAGLAVLVAGALWRHSCRRR